MTTYTIKPLVWTIPNTKYATDCAVATCGILRVTAYADGYWRITACNDGGNAILRSDFVREMSWEDTKLAAESAYRTLLMQALEEVQSTN